MGVIGVALVEKYRGGRGGAGVLGAGLGDGRMRATFDGGVVLGHDVVQRTEKRKAREKEKDFRLFNGYQKTKATVRLDTELWS